MPINYKDYHQKWRLISYLIRFVRAKGKCEWCGAINLSYVNKATREICLPDEDNATRIVLTVAHLDHDKENNKFNNLAALCQRCHLNYDRGHHIENRKYGRNFKKQQFKLDI